MRFYNNLKVNEWCVNKKVYNMKLNECINKKMHQPGIEPGSTAWKAIILPLNY